MRCDGTCNGHNDDCESKAAHTLALADPSVPCGAQALGGQWRAACTFACCIVQPKPESDSEYEERLGAKRARRDDQASGLALCWRADDSLGMMDVSSLSSEHRWSEARLKVGLLLCRERPTRGAEIWERQGAAAKRPDALLRSCVQKATRRRLVGTAVRAAHQHLKQEARTKLQKQVERLCVIAIEDSSPCEGYAHLCWLAAALGATEADCGGKANVYSLLKSDVHLLLHATREIAHCPVAHPPAHSGRTEAWPFDEHESFGRTLDSLGLLGTRSAAASAAAAVVLGRLVHKGDIRFDHEIRQKLAVEAAAATSGAGAEPPKMLRPPPAAWLQAIPDECNQPLVADDELYYAADKHVLPTSSYEPFLTGELPRAPSRDAAKELTWAIAGHNVRSGREEPTFADGSWQKVMLSKWPSVARAEWER